MVVRIVLSSLLVVLVSFPAAAQRKGQLFDYEFAKRSMREVLPPAATCEENQASDRGVCTYRAPNFELIMSADRNEIKAVAAVRVGPPTDYRDQVRLIPRLAEKYGFDDDVWKSCITEASKQAPLNVTYPKRINADFSMECSFRLTRDSPKEWTYVTLFYVLPPTPPKPKTF
jgi:hypothetical protein